MSNRHPDDDRVLWPWIAAAFLVAALMWSAIIGVGVAVAAPTPKASDVTVLQAKADTYADWIASTLHADVPRTSFSISRDLYFASSAAERYPDGSVKVLPTLAREFRRVMDSGGELDPQIAYVRRGAVYLPSVHVVLHELLHRPQNAACWGSIEESVTDAVAVDILPAWGARFMRGTRTFGIPVQAYASGVAAIRAASARATGSPNWRTRAARTWVRQLWGASCAGRAAMLAQAA